MLRSSILQNPFFWPLNNFYLQKDASYVFTTSLAKRTYWVHLQYAYRTTPTILALFRLLARYPQNLVLQHRFFTAINLFTYYWFFFLNAYTHRELPNRVWMTSEVLPLYQNYFSYFPVYNF